MPSSARHRPASAGVSSADRLRVRACAGTSAVSSTAHRVRWSAPSPRFPAPASHSWPHMRRRPVRSGTRGRAGATPEARPARRPPLLERRFAGQPCNDAEGRLTSQVPRLTWWFLQMRTYYNGSKQVGLSRARLGGAGATWMDGYRPDAQHPRARGADRQQCGVLLIVHRCEPRDPAPAGGAVPTNSHACCNMLAIVRYRVRQAAIES
jgi:hypothetical protein